MKRKKHSCGRFASEHCSNKQCTWIVCGTCNVTADGHGNSFSITYKQGMSDD